MPPEPPRALLFALAAPVVIAVVAVAVASPPLPPPTPGFVEPIDAPVPPEALAVLVASGPGPGPALATASEPSCPSTPSAPMTVMVSACAGAMQSTRDKAKKRAVNDAVAAPKSFAFIIAPQRPPHCPLSAIGENRYGPWGAIFWIARGEITHQRRS